MREEHVVQVGEEPDRGIDARQRTVLMVQVSQGTNVKLRTIAEELVRTGVLPS